MKPDVRVGNVRLLALVLAFVLAGLTGSAGLAGLCPGVLAAQVPAPRVSGAIADPPLTRRAELKHRLDRLIADPALRTAHVGLTVEVAETGEVLYRHQGEKRFVPASNTKLITAATALEVLGGEYRWTTRLAADGPIRLGTLEGNLWIIGGGDPHLTRESLATWPDLLRSAGIQRIAGSLIGDDSAFEDPQWGTGWMWDDLYASWAAGVSALELSPNRVRSGVVPGARIGTPASLFQEDGDPDVPLVNRVLTGAPGSEVRLRFMPPPEGGTVELVGWVPLGPDTTRLSLATPHPTLHLLKYLSQVLKDAGVQVAQEARRARVDEHVSEPTWTVDLASEPLSEILGLALKPSDNQMAETLLLTVGREEGSAGTAAEGLRIVYETLGNWGVPPSAVELTDGSGMSRYNQVTPDAIVRLLRALWRRPDFPTFLEALPVAGVDGTLRRRMLGTTAERNAAAKTGSLSSVRALSGYVSAGDGSTLIFSLLINGYAAPGSVATAIEDLLIEQLALYRRAVEPGWPANLREEAR